MTDSKAETQEKYDKAFEHVLQTLKDRDSISIENTIGLCRDYRRDIDPRMVAEVLENMRREGWFIPNPETPSSPWLKLSMHGKEQSKQAHPVLAPAKRSGKLIEDTTLPDDFYKRVVNEIIVLNITYPTYHVRIWESTTLQRKDSPLGQESYLSQFQ